MVTNSYADAILCNWNKCNGYESKKQKNIWSDFQEYHHSRSNVSLIGIRLQDMNEWIQRAMRCKRNSTSRMHDEIPALESCSSKPARGIEHCSSTGLRNPCDTSRHGHPMHWSKDWCSQITHATGTNKDMTYPAMSAPSNLQYNYYVRLKRNLQNNCTFTFTRLHAISALRSECILVYARTRYLPDTR